MNRFPSPDACLVACVIFSWVLALPAYAGSQAAAVDTTYMIYHEDGSPADFDDLLRAADTVEVVLIGELHHDPTSKELTRELAEHLQNRSSTSPPLALSLEKFERDVQPILNEYLQDLIVEEHFLAGTRPWPEYEDQYRSLVETAKTEGWPVIAANVPRRYANRVARQGEGALVELPAHVQQWLPPLPYEGPSPGYRDEWLQVMAGAGHETQDAGESEGGSAHPENEFSNLLQAQALWDAGMAHSIAQQLRRAPEIPVLHLVGRFHVEGGTGIQEHLVRYRPHTSILVITVRPAADPAAFDTDEYGGRADFILLSDQTRLGSAVDS